MPEFLITHPSTIYATVTARDAQHALLVARAGAQWLPSDTPNLDLNEMHAEPIEPREAPTPYRPDVLTDELNDALTEEVS